MSAPMKLPVKIGEATYTLVFKFGTIRYFEQETGQKIDQAFPFLTAGEKISRDERAALADGVQWSLWGALFWAALQSAHRITRDAADDLIDVAGFDAVVEWCMRGIYAHLAGNPDLLEPPAESPTTGEAPAAKAQAKKKA